MSTELHAAYDGRRILLNWERPLVESAPSEWIGEHVRRLEPTWIWERPAARRGFGEVERESWHLLSAKGLAGAYGEDEDEYSLDLIKEANPDYEGR